jgi:hypothetical protein
MTTLSEDACLPCCVDLHAEDPASGAADIEAEPGHVVCDGGRRSFHEGQHILRWLLRWILMDQNRVSSSFIKHKVAVVAD